MLDQEIQDVLDRDIIKTQNNLKKIEDDNKKALLVYEDVKHIEKWLLTKNQATRSSYRSDLKLFFSFFAENGKAVSLKEITTEHVSIYLEKHKHFEASTLARKKSAISSLLNYLVKKEYIIKNHCDLLDPISVPDKTFFKVLDHELIKKMIEKEKIIRNKTILRTLYKTGLRVSELISLKFSSLRFRNNKYEMVVIGKGSKARLIKIDEKTYLDMMDLKPDETINNDDHIFRSKNSKNKLSRFAVWEVVKKAAKNANIDPSVSTHWLRHSHATLAHERGEDSLVIQQTLGHRSLATTKKYTQINPDRSSGDKVDI
jgi:integrase/recombinase XerD